MRGSEPATLEIDREYYGVVGETKVHRYVLRNQGGLTVRILDYGGIIQSLEAPDRHGESANVVLGFPALEDYVANNEPAAARVYLGSIIGRYANRIAGGTFVLDGTEYRLPRNNGQNCLHGGTAGFDTHVWGASVMRSPDSVGVRLTHLSPDGDQGYPGRLATTVTYRLDNQNRVHITYLATTDAPTVLNLTNHTYWNLAGEGSGPIDDQRLMINAGRFCPVDADLIPDGSPIPVDGSPFDFRTPVPIGARLGVDDPQLSLAHGYDHNWVLEQAEAGSLSLAARVHDPRSGRRLTMWTTEPGLQFYSGNFLTEALIGTGGRPYHRGAGFALEPQHFPDSPNRPDFPSTILRPGDAYRQNTVFELDLD
ncbi:aldose epimerase family protein [Amycolatopsis sp. NPDC059657]|uniref:aldose epimerase family protein n=1 Tax=Amycolatopsis sp. NPDC059657 TaxID=3346899 RepID=UPI00366FA85C